VTPARKPKTVAMGDLSKATQLRSVWGLLTTDTAVSKVCVQLEHSKFRIQF
jgi:hypothetical protein